MGSPTMGKAPGDVAAHRVAAALLDLRCGPLSRCTRGLRGPSPGADLTTQVAGSNSLLTFGAVFPDAVRLMPPDVGTPGCLSWGCRRSPLRRSRCAESTPGETLASLTFGPPSADDDRVPSMWFFATPTACSSATAPGCCTRLPTMGFVAFPTLARGHSRDANLPFRALLPRHSIDPGRIQNLGHDQAREVCRHTAIRFTRDLGLRAVEPLEPTCARSAMPSTSRLFAVPRAVPCLRVAAPPRPVLSWACSPCLRT